MYPEKKTFLVLGASSRQSRYANLAVKRLVDAEQEVIAIGKSGGMINDIPILKIIPEDIKPHTVLMYLSAKNQVQYEEILLKLKPQRVVFNPGAENRELADKLKEQGIKIVESCALILLTLKHL